jgi:hypothetical protein
MNTRRNFTFEFVPFCHWFWRTYDRYEDFPDIVNVFGGGPFFQYWYYEKYCPIKHKDIKIQGYN